MLAILLIVAFCLLSLTGLVVRTWLRAGKCNVCGVDYAFFNSLRKFPEAEDRDDPPPDAA